MSSNLSPENEAFLNNIVSSGMFPDRSQALDEAVLLLKKRVELLHHIDEGTAQLEKGDYVDYDLDELREFCEEIKSEGRQRLEAGNPQS